MTPTKTPPNPKDLENPPYFTLSKNPHLTEFIEQNRTHDEREPVAAFTETQSASKASALYNMHTYWSKKPHEAIESYIRHYTRPGDLVLDPFSGSGGTSVAALMNGRKAVAIDLSPAAAFITYHYTHPVDPSKLKAAYDRLMARVGKELEWLYETELNGQPARTGYTVYSGAIECPQCGTEIVVYHAKEVEVPKTDKKGNPVLKNGVPQMETRLACTNDTCGFTFLTRDLSKYKSINSKPVKVSIMDLRGKRHERTPNIIDEEKLYQIDRSTIPYWTPPHRMMNNNSNEGSWGDKWRQGTANFRKITELFTKRNLWGLSILLNGIQKEVDYGARSKLMLCFSSILWSTSKMLREEKRAVQMGTYYFPLLSREIKISNSFTYKFEEQLQKANEYAWNAFAGYHSNAAVASQSATDLSNIPDNSMDYVFTDPPYAGQVQYGELNFVWEAWLNLPTDWHDQEIIENKTRGKTLENWKNMLGAAMKEVFRVLKPGRWCTLTYHDTNSSTWEMLHDLMRQAGFVPDDADGVVAIDTDQKSYNQMMANKNAQTDLVVNFYKPRFAGDRPPSSNRSGRDLSTSGKSLEQRVGQIIMEHLEQHPGQTKAQLYDAVISRLVRSGEIQAFHFEKILDLYKNSLWVVDGRYHLPNQEIPDVDTGLFGWEGVPDDRPEQKVVGFIYRLLADHPLEYGDILAQYNTSKALSHARRNLTDAGCTLEHILQGGFVYEEDRRVWRRPSSQERTNLLAARNRRLERSFRNWLALVRPSMSSPLFGARKIEAPELDLEALLWGLDDLYGREDWRGMLEVAEALREHYGHIPDVLEDYVMIAEANA